MKLTKTTSGKQKVKISKSEWEAIGKQAGWKPELPMPLYDDVNEIKGKIISWIEEYMDNYPQEQWGDKQAQIYRDIASFCNGEAEGLGVTASSNKWQRTAETKAAVVKKANEFIQDIQSPSAPVEDTAAEKAKARKMGFAEFYDWAETHEELAREVAQEHYEMLMQNYMQLRGINILEDVYQSDPDVEESAGMWAYDHMPDHLAMYM